MRRSLVRFALAISLPAPLAPACVPADSASPCAVGVPWCDDRARPLDVAHPPDADGADPNDAHEVDAIPDEGDAIDATGDAGHVDARPAGPDPGLTLAEVLPDPEGADGDGFAEFVELRGVPGAATDGWVLALVDGRTGDTYASVPLLGAVPADGLVVIGGTGVPEADMILPAALQQGPDGLVLFDDRGSARDAVAWGGDVSTIPDAPVDRPGEGVSLVRCAGGWRTGAPSPGRDDTVACDAPTAPDAGVGDADPAPWCAPAAASLRLHEVFADPEGPDADGGEFVELLGPPGTALDGVRLLGRGDDGAVWLDQPLDGLTTDVEGFALVGAGVDGWPDVSLDAPLQNGPDGLALQVCGDVVDEVHWPAGGTPGRSLARCPDAGWFTADPTPRGPNDGFDDGPCGPRCHPLVPHVRISEILFDVPGTDRGHEFVELSGPAGVRVDGVRLVGVNGSNGVPWFTTPLVGVIPETARFVVGGEFVTPAHAPLDTTLQNGPDSLVLIDCDDAPIDAVAWGHFGAFDTPAGEGDPAATPPSGQSLTRTDGDTDDNASDFAAAPPSPGW